MTVDSQEVSQLCLRALASMATSPKSTRERLTDAWSTHLRWIKVIEVPPKLRATFERIAGVFLEGPVHLDDNVIEARMRDVVDLYEGTIGLYEVE